VAVSCDNAVSDIGNMAYICLCNLICQLQQSRCLFCKITVDYNLNTTAVLLEWSCWMLHDDSCITGVKWSCWMLHDDSCITGVKLLDVAWCREKAKACVTWERTFVLRFRQRTGCTQLVPSLMWHLSTTECRATLRSLRPSSEAVVRFS